MLTVRWEAIGKPIGMGASVSVAADRSGFPSRPRRGPCDTIRT